MIPNTLLYYTCTTNVKNHPVKSKGDAGIDLALTEDVWIDGKCSSKLLGTGLSFQLPTNTVGLIWPRSSMAVKGIETGGGVIDESYRGEVKLILRNHSSYGIKLKAGDRVAQLIIQPCIHTIPVPVQYQLNNTIRGTNGFGSTGK
jgi:dUTP pyrophosphatase